MHYYVLHTCLGVYYGKAELQGEAMTSWHQLANFHE